MTALKKKRKTFWSLFILGVGVENQSRMPNFRREFEIEMNMNTLNKVLTYKSFLQKYYNLSRIFLWWNYLLAIEFLHFPHSALNWHRHWWQREKKPTSAPNIFYELTLWMLLTLFFLMTKRDLRHFRLSFDNHIRSHVLFSFQWLIWEVLVNIDQVSIS